MYDRLFKGDNTMYQVMAAEDIQKCKQEKGGLPLQTMHGLRKEDSEMACKTTLLLAMCLQEKRHGGSHLGKLTLCKTTLVQLLSTPTCQC
jgi:hypothetical protein